MAGWLAGWTDRWLARGRDRSRQLGQVDGGSLVVKPRNVDVWLVQPIKNQKERNGYTNRWVWIQRLTRR